MKIFLAGVIEQTFPHSISSPRKFCYIANYPPRGKICYIANVPHSRTSHLHVIGSNCRQHAKIVFWKSSPFAMTQIVLQIYPYMAFICSQINAILTKFLVMVKHQTLRIFDRLLLLLLFLILCDKSSIYFV